MDMSGGLCIPIHQHINSPLFVLYLYALLTEIKANLKELVVNCSDWFCSKYKSSNQN